MCLTRNAESDVFLFAGVAKQLLMIGFPFRTPGPAISAMRAHQVHCI